MTDAGVQAPIHKNDATTFPRINNFITSTRFQDKNLVGKLYSDPQSVALSYYPLPDASEGAWENYSFDFIISQDFTPVELGGSYGPTWSTHWFKVEFTTPAEWIDKEIRFRWDSGTEATLWDNSVTGGKVLQGLTGSGSQERTEYILTYSTTPQVLYVEAVASDMFGAGTSDQIDPTNPNFYFSVKTCEIVAMDRNIYKLTRDLEVLYQLAEALMPGTRGYMAMFTANQMVNSIIAGDFATASQLADNHLAKTNGDRVHNLAAIGNCHIDSAWLWPYSETKRKVARSYSSQLNLMDLFPDYIFVASQAQQWAWCEQYYPELFTRITQKVTDGQFLPVGTTWIEMDGNVPSGESFIRQFYYGKKYYQEKFNYVCNEFWLPDTFGYSAQIPAMMKHVNLSRFLTQKMSWNIVNTFPHHNFMWEGIDGSTVLAHFPPGNSYSMTVNISEVKRTIKNLEDKGRVSTSAFLYGYGDGGGGPNEEMIQRAKRLDDVDGCAKMYLTTPDTLFEQLESEQHNFMRWTGELYLELHNGTYTSQADIKKLNRETEFMLRDAELMTCCVIISSLTPSGDLSTFEKAWKNMLLNQFHDVLPGTSIEIVYPDATELFEESQSIADNLYTSAANDIFGSGQTQVAMNTLQWTRREVVEISSEAIKNKKVSLSQNAKSQHTRASVYYVVDAPGFGYGSLDSLNFPNYPVVYTYNDVDDLHVLDNGLIRAEIASGGQVVSLQVVGDSKSRDLFQRDGINKYGNQVTLFDDEPLYWDAWDIMDYHLETPVVLNSAGSSNITSLVTVTEQGSYIVRLQWSMTVGKSSTLSQEIIMKADTPYLIFDTTVDWYESHKVLKTGFDTHLLARNAAYDIQFGYLERPTHMNTSWDTARYEVCGHKWADISEPDFGMAVLNDSKYGWTGRGSALYLSLLKAPKAPDFNCDMKQHNFKYAVYPHLGNIQQAEVMRKAYEFNNPLRLTDIDAAYALQNPTWSLISVDGDGIVLHTVKPTDDGSDDIILRMFECNGQQSTATFTIQRAATSIYEADGFDTIKEPITFTTGASDTTFDVTLLPFKIYALRISFNAAPLRKKVEAAKPKNKISPPKKK